MDIPKWIGYVPYSQPYLIITFAVDSWSYKLTKVQISNIIRNRIFCWTFACLSILNWSKFTLFFSEREILGYTKIITNYWKTSLRFLLMFIRFVYLCQFPHDPVYLRPDSCNFIFLEHFWSFANVGNQNINEFLLLVHCEP